MDGRRLCEQGLRQEKGRGIEKDSDKAASFYRQAADAGNADATLGSAGAMNMALACPSINQGRPSASGNRRSSTAGKGGASMGVVACSALAGPSIRLPESHFIKNRPTSKIPAGILQCVDGGTRTRRQIASASGPSTHRSGKGRVLVIHDDFDGFAAPARKWVGWFRASALPRRRPPDLQGWKRRLCLRGRVRRRPGLLFAHRTGHFDADGKLAVRDHVLGVDRGRGTGSGRLGFTVPVSLSSPADAHRVCPGALRGRHAPSRRNRGLAAGQYLRGSQLASDRGQFPEHGEVDGDGHPGSGKASPACAFPATHTNACSR